MTEKTCPECNGEGVVDQGTEDEMRCPTCNGSGIVPDDGQSEEVWNTHPKPAMTSSGIDQASSTRLPNIQFSVSYSHSASNRA
jgi:hypothetical protein